MSAFRSVCVTAYLSKSRQRFFETNVVKSYYTNYNRLLCTHTERDCTNRAFCLCLVKNVLDNNTFFSDNDTLTEL